VSEAKRRLIRQLRLLADSTTFPEEAKSARAKADKLEAELPKQQQAPPTTLDDMAHVLDAASYMRAGFDIFNQETLRAMMQQAMDQMRKDGL
jgi:hypothetical protein